MGFFQLIYYFKLVSFEQIIEAATENVKLVFLCNPNNPTGNSIGESQIFSIIEELSDKAIVVVDEAYIEFSSCESLIGQISQYPNLVVLRTLSKAYGLAGARCGVAVANKPIIDLLQKVRAPYPISTPVAELVTDVFSKPNVLNNVPTILENRTKLSMALEDSPLVTKVWPSDANFLLVKTTDSEKFKKMFSDEGIIIRNRSDLLNLENCVRITVGTNFEMNRFIEILNINGEQS